MVREALVRRGVGARHGFRWRGGDVSRLEALSDAVFGFALALLVVSTEVPATFHELSKVMWGFIPFSLCFMLICFVWYRHYLFHRRYGLEDLPTAVLNFILLFVILFYVYPLKFMSVFFVKLMSGQALTVEGPGGVSEPILRGMEGRSMFIVYSAGYLAVFVLFTLLHHHAWKKRQELELTPAERMETRESIASSLSMASFGALSVLIAAYAPVRLVGLAGFCYWLIPFSEMFIGSYYGKRSSALYAAEAAAREADTLTPEEVEARFDRRDG